LFIGLTFGSHFLPAQTITNVQVRQEGLEIIVTYDMAGGLQKDDEIKVGYSTDGGFRTIEDLQSGKGIGVKTVAKLKPYATVYD